MSDHSLLEAYAETVSRAYSDLEKGILSGADTPALLASKCGAVCSAASKRLKCDLILGELASACAAGLDVTPTHAITFTHNLLGRGISNRSANAALGKPGRRADDKSSITQADLRELHVMLLAKLESVGEAMREIRENRRKLFNEQVECALKKRNDESERSRKATKETLNSSPQTAWDF